jgi:hypothetical protein
MIKFPGRVTPFDPACPARQFLLLATGRLGPASRIGLHSGRGLFSLNVNVRKHSSVIGRKTGY